MYGAAAAVIAIPKVDSVIIVIANRYCSMERSDFKASSHARLYAARLAQERRPHGPKAAVVSEFIPIVVASQPEARAVM